MKNSALLFLTVLGAVICAAVALQRPMLHGRPLSKWGRLQPPRHVPEDVGISLFYDWFEQKLDHFDSSDTRTWNQRYYVNDRHYEDGGPAFIFIGGEGAASEGWMLSGQWIVAAEQYHALCFQIEHRYYGESHPTEDASVENLQYLSSEQALADIAYFIEQMKETDSRTTNAYWVVFGGSYSGSLAAWARYKYPHLIHAAVASSAPVLAQTDFYGYMDVVQSSVDYYDPSCSGHIQNATDQLNQLVSGGEWDNITSLFHICSDFDETSDLDIATLYESLSGNFAYIVQYNLEMTYTVADLCEVMADETIGTELERYARVNRLMMPLFGERCVDVSYTALIEYMKESNWTDEATSSGSRTWVYQTCSEFGYYQTTDSDAQPFGEYFPLSYFIKQCVDIYGDRFNESFVDISVDWTNTFYGGKDPRVAHVVFPNGNIDPWHYLGITDGLNDYSPAIFIDGTAHCADMYDNEPDDLPDLVAARAEIISLIGEWLGISESSTTEAHATTAKSPVTTAPAVTTPNRGTSNMRPHSQLSLYFSFLMAAFIPLICKYFNF